MNANELADRLKNELEDAFLDDNKWNILIFELQQARKKDQERTYYENQRVN